MEHQRLHRILTERTNTSGDAIFGEHDLISHASRVARAPIERVAVLAEAFLPKVDGVSRTSYLTVRYLQQTGREVLVFAPDSAVEDVYGSEVVRVPSFALSVAPETRVAVPNGLLEQRLREFNPDLIHLGSPAIMGVYGMIVGRELNIPVVANYQTDLPGYAAHYGAPLLEQPIRDWLRYLHNGCHVNLVPTQTVRRKLLQEGFHRLHLWGRGVNSTAFHPKFRNDAMRQRLLNGRDPQQMLGVFVGRLANEKQVELLIEVAKLDGVALTIIGDGHAREDLEHLFEGTGTHFTGYLVGEELSQAYASADAFFFSGGNETFGQVAQEALASGIPAVVTDQGSVGEIIQQGVTGFVVNHEPQAFADAAKILRDNPTLRQQMGQNARQYAEARPWAAILSELERHYNHALRVNKRFKSQFGYTTYHRTARIRSVAATVGTWLASTFYGRRV